MSETPSETARKYPAGTRVGVPGQGFHVCGTCYECKSSDEDTPGFSNRCGKGLSNGISKDGGLAQYAVVDARQVALLPDAMSAVNAAPLITIGWRAESEQYVH